MYDKYDSKELIAANCELQAVANALQEHVNELDNDSGEKPHTETIPVQPIFGGEPLMCTANVQNRIRAMGGKAVFGWRVDDYYGYVDVLTNHCVWESPEGELQNVTPIFGGVAGEMAIIEWPEAIEFIRDESSAFADRPRPNRYRALVDDKKVTLACEYMARSDGFLLSGDLEKCQYWTSRANQQVSHLGLSWNTPASLDAASLIECGMSGGRA